MAEEIPANTGSAAQPQGWSLMTPRLCIRHFHADDLDAFAALCADPQVMRYVGDGTTLTRSEVADWIAICAEKYALRGYGTSAVFLQADNQFLGYCGVVRAPGNDFDELIYVFHTSTWGHGYATEAAAAMLDYVFENSQLADIYATIDPGNDASIHVANKLGMVLDRVEVDDEGPVNYHCITRDDWRKGRGDNL